jgi:NNP family nitrate/nitrite transporter-like MFS transporter
MWGSFKDGFFNGSSSGFVSSAPLHLPMCFAVWTIFSIIGVQIKEELGLSDTEFGLLVGTPILTGSLIRLVSGYLGGPIRGTNSYAAVMVSCCLF